MYLDRYPGHSNWPPLTYIWELGTSPKPTDRLNAAGAIALGLIVFVMIPTTVIRYLPFYYKKREEGLDTLQVWYVIMSMWWASWLVIWAHIVKQWNKWLESPTGKACIK